ncbi:hypothetical protein [Nocardia brasiliensis]|uniref:hypothetical protein n=1 Tax=Nocardia brasiliensis TaxID=37326 RepID=UPI0024576BB4|nr:hypothetical protein [Nocardia brasiliensis]
MAEWILPHGAQRYLPGDPRGPQPQRADLIRWSMPDDVAVHIVMATGRAVGGSPEVYSFWPPPDDAFTMDPDTLSSSTETAAIKLSTIDELSSFIAYPEDPIPEVWFGRGPW